MKAIISWFAENHVAANLLMLFIIAAGVITALTIKLEVMPEATLDKIAITVEYPGASPSEVEEGVIRKIEDEVAGLAGIKRIDSTAKEGYGIVTIEVVKGWDIKKLLDEVKAEVDRINTFPEEAEDPVVREITRKTQVIDVAIYGNVPEGTLKELAEQKRDDITNLPGVTQAEVYGVRNPEVQIEIPERTLREYGLTLAQVSEIVRRASLDLPAGRIKEQGKELLVRTKGRKYHAPEFRNIVVISRPDGSRVTLGQIAEVKDGFEDQDLRTRFQGKPAAIILVYRVAEQSALKVAAAVKRYVDRIRPTLPVGVSIDLYQDRSEILWSRIRLLLKNMSIGLALVGILLGLFLNLKLAFWVALGIPISFAAGLMCFPQLDVSINMISLFAFIMVLGIVVDDAIVIGENVFRKRQRLEDPLRASIEGTLEVGRPVIFSVLTTVAAFWPLLLGSGIMGKFMRNIPIVVIIVLLGSLTEALLILPAHLARSKFNAGGNANKTRKEIISKALNWVISEPYRKILNYCLRWRYASAAVALTLLLLATGLWTGRIIKFTLFPKVESDVLMCNLTMPAGTPLTKTQQMVKYLEDSAILALGEAEKERPKGSPPLLRYMASLIGAQMAGHGPRAGSADTGGNLAQIFIQLLGEEQRKISATKLLNLWRKKAGPIPEAESLTFRAEFFSPGNPIEVHLSLDDEQMLKRAVEDLKRELREYPGVYDINDSFIPGKKEIRIKLRPQGRDLGFNLKDLAQQVRFAFYGAEAMRFERDEDEVKVMVRYPEEQRSLESTLMHMRLRSPTGHEVPFSEVAQINIARGYSSIERAQRRRVIKVTADVDEEVANAHEIRSYLQGEFLPTLKNLYPGLRYSTEGAGKEEHESLSDVINGFLIALLAIYALLAIPLRSFSQPFVIMLAVPFSLVGAVVGHLVMGLNLSLLSLFGMVGLAGVAVNDSLVLVDAINRLRSEGRSLWEAVVMAGSLRFRPIVLTSVTTFAGLMPLILEKSFQAKFLIPMAVSLGFGVLFATGVTLIVIPCGYLILNDIKGLVRVKEKGI